MPSLQSGDEFAIFPPPGEGGRASGVAEDWIPEAVRPLGWAEDTAARAPRLSQTGAHAHARAAKS